MKKCKVCGRLTETIFNIELKPVHICEECARRIFLQQATWYANQEFKNLTLPRVSGRSVQLKAFREWTMENLDQEDIVSQKAVDRYLESL